MTVLVLAEHNGQQLRQATRQAISAAQAWQAPIYLLVVGHQADAVVEEAARIQGVTQVLYVDGSHLLHPLAEDVAAILVHLGREHKVILAPHTAFAKNILPRAAALLDMNMVSDVLQILAPTTYVRPMYAGNVLVTVENTEAIQILTVRASSFVAVGDGGPATITTKQAPAPTVQARWLSETRNISDRPELASARVVVSGGRPLGEQFEALLSPLAAALDAALGATRAAVDAGFAPNDIQVGQTGTIVAPDLYIAIGVSGAVQHLAGMKDSKVIVAINHDPEAPIFHVADYGLVADLFEVVPELTESLR